MNILMGCREILAAFAFSQSYLGQPQTLSSKTKPQHPYPTSLDFASPSPHLLFQEPQLAERVRLLEEKLKEARGFRML